MTSFLPLDVERLAESAAGAAAAGAADDAADAALAVAAGAALPLLAFGGGGASSLPLPSLLLLLAAAMYCLATSAAAAHLLPDAPADPRGVIGSERVERDVFGLRFAGGPALSLRLSAPRMVGEKPPPL